MTQGLRKEKRTNQPNQPRIGNTHTLSVVRLPIHALAGAVLSHHAIVSVSEVFTHPRLRRWIRVQFDLPEVVSCRQKLFVVGTVALVDIGAVSTFRPDSDGFKRQGTTIAGPFRVPKRGALGNLPAKSCVPCNETSFTTFTFSFFSSL